MKNIVPKDKFDQESVDNLKKYSFEEIEQYIPALLEWLQDANWPVAGPIFNYFKPHINDIDDEIVKILRTDDEVWKYWILGLIDHSEVVPNDVLMKEITRIAEHPTQNEIEEELHEVALDIIKRLSE